MDKIINIKNLPKQLPATLQFDICRDLFIVSGLPLSCFAMPKCKEEENLDERSTGD